MFWKKTDKLDKTDTDASNQNNAVEKVSKFIDGFTQELIELNKLAQSNLDDWYLFLKQLEIEPVSKLKREQAKLTGLPLPQVAFPTEYRLAVNQLKVKANAKIPFLKAEVENDFEAEELLDEFVRRKLNSLIEDELNKYLNVSKPAVSVSDIFANAATSLNKYSVKEVGDKSYSIKCKTCGAARLEEDQYGECFYCGTPLFN